MHLQIVYLPRVAYGPERQFEAATNCWTEAKIEVSVKPESAAYGMHGLSWQNWPSVKVNRKTGVGDQIAIVAPSMREVESYLLETEIKQQETEMAYQQTIIDEVEKRKLRITNRLRTLAIRHLKVADAPYEEEEVL